MAQSREYKGFVPLMHQRDVIRELIDARGSGKVVVVKSSRQKGKTATIENILLYYALNYRGTENFCLSPVLSQSRKIFKELLKAIEEGKCLKAKNEQLLEMTFINGSKVKFLSGQQNDSLRGYTADGIVCIDEAAFVDDDSFYKILPWMDVNQAPMLICSSPFVKSGFFWNY